jgi:predicted phage tail component-like protein
MDIRFDDQYNLKDFGLICEKGHVNPMTPTIENKTLSIPGRYGLYDFGTEIRERELNIPLVIIEKNNMNIQYKLREFITFLFDVYGRPRNIKMTLDYEPDKYYTVRCNSQINIKRAIQTGQFNVSFIACDPFSYSIAYADEITWGSTVITFQSHYLLGHQGSDGLTSVTSPTTLNILVDGMAIKPVIEITGSATSLTLSANGNSITFNSFANATWVIDCSNYTVTKDSINAFNSASLREFVLLPGNNQVQISGTGINLSIRIKSRDKYI